MMEHKPITPQRPAESAAEARLDTLLDSARRREEKLYAASPALRARIAALPFAVPQTASATTTPEGWTRWASRLLGLGPRAVWTPRALAPTAAMLAVVALLGFTAGYQGLGTVLVNGSDSGAAVLSLEEDSLLPLDPDRV